MYSDVRFPHIDDNLVTTKLPYKAFTQYNEDIDIIVVEAGFHKNETVFGISFVDYDHKIPLLDQMICTYFKINPRCIVYRKIDTLKKINPNEFQKSKDAMIALLGKEKNKLTRTELRLLGL